MVSHDTPSFSRAAMSNAAGVMSRAQTAPPVRADLGATLRTNVPALDGLRGVAIVAVLAHQLCIDGYSGGGSLVERVRLPFQAGWAGVQLFFVLSGFLITGILLDTRHASNFWSSFYARRTLRIFPLYYLALTATFVAVPRFFHLPEAVLAQHRHQWFYWAYLANLASPVGGGDVDALGHCWSLSVEEQFYLLWPFAVRFLHRRGLVRLCVGVAVASFLLRVGLRVAGANPELAYELTPARADALALGALAAVVARRREWVAWLERRLGRATACSVAVLAAIGALGGGLSRTHVVTQTAGYTAIAIASALIILQVTLETARGHGRLAAALASPVLRRYGKYSYAIYLFHHPLEMLVTRTLVAPRLAALSIAAFLGLQAAYFIVGGLGLLVLGAFSYRFVEKPFLDLRRFFVAREVALAPSA